MIQSGVHKKKPRIRNRQRNKINQVPQDQGESPDAIASSLKSNGSKAANGVESKPPVEKPLLTSGNSLLESLSKIGQVENPQENDTIRLIQQLLRRKLLAKNSAVPSSENKPSTDPVKIVTQPKEIKSEEKKPKISSTSVTPKLKTEAKASGISKEEEINDLLKCLGSKLPKGN